MLIPAIQIVTWGDESIKWVIFILDRNTQSRITPNRKTPCPYTLYTYLEGCSMCDFLTVKCYLSLPLSSCSARATICKPQEICGPTLVSRWTLLPFTPRPSAPATRATCVPSAPSVRLAASARWVSNTCMAQMQHLETRMRATVMLLYLIALCTGHYRHLNHPQVTILEVHSWLFRRHSVSQLKSIGITIFCCFGIMQCFLQFILCYKQTWNFIKLRNNQCILMSTQGCLV